MDRGSGVGGRGPGILGPGFWILNSGPLILVHGSWIPAHESWVPAALRLGDRAPQRLGWAKGSTAHVLVLPPLIFSLSFNALGPTGYPTMCNEIMDLQTLVVVLTPCLCLSLYSLDHHCQSYYSTHGGGRFSTGMHINTIHWYNSNNNNNTTTCIANRGRATSMIAVRVTTCSLSLSLSLPCVLLVT